MLTEASAEPLCLSDLVHSGAMVGEQRTGARRFWTGREERLLREHFPAGGLAACLPHLVGRSAGSIYQRANALGLVSPAAKKTPRGERWATSDGIDAIIRRGYAADTHKGAVADLARRLGRPRWWVSKRAVKLGLVPPRRKEPVWSAVELDLIDRHAHKDPATIRAILRKRGFTRTATAIVVKLKREGADRADPDHLTATGLATVMGVDAKVVTRWIDKGWLRAARRGTGRVSVQGGDQWWIHRRDVARFVVGNAAAVDIRKVDKDWFIDLLAEHGRPAHMRADAA